MASNGDWLCSAVRKAKVAELRLAHVVARFPESCRRLQQADGAGPASKHGQPADKQPTPARPTPCSRRQGKIATDGGHAERTKESIAANARWVQAHAQQVWTGEVSLLCSARCAFWRADESRGGGARRYCGPGGQAQAVPVCVTDWQATSCSMPCKNACLKPSLRPCDLVQVCNWVAAERGTGRRR